MVNGKKDLFKHLTKNAFKKHSVGLSVKRLVTDTNGLLIDKNTLPVNLKTKYPFWLFAKFDKDGAYSIGRKVTPVLGGLYIKSFVNGLHINTNDIVGYSAFNEIKNLINIGDIVHLFTDDVDAPSVFIWVIQSTIVSSINSIIDNSATTQEDNRLNSLNVKTINMLSDNITQYDENIDVVKIDNIGTYRKQSITGTMYRQPELYLANIIVIPFEFKMDQYLGLYSYLQFNTDVLNFDFNIEKIN